MKKFYLLIAFTSISRLGWAQASICDSCCEESFPYEFCSPLGQYVACSSNPNGDATPTLSASKAFIPSCVLVDTMPSDAMWQPTGPPPAPASLLSIGALGNDSNEESGAATQFENDQTLYSQIPAQPPFPPTPVSPPENTCGDDPYPPGTLVYPTRQDILDNYIYQGEIGNTYAEWGSPTPSDYPVPPWKKRWNDNGTNQDIWDYDEDEYDASLAQFCLDTSNFLEGLSPAHIDGADSGYDDNGIDLARSYYALDNEMLDGEYNREIDSVNGDETKHDTWVSCDSTFEADSASDAVKYAKYEGAAQQYTADSTAWAANVRDYVQVFKQSQAQADADSALHQWLNVCEPPIQPCETNPPCCIHVEMDDNPLDFSSTGTGISGILSKTVGNGSTTITFLKCKPTGCESANMTIKVNITTEFLTNEWQPVSGSTPSQYTLYQVNQTEFFTGAPDTTAPGYSDFSFFQLLEHEIGHCFGLHHPDDSVDGHLCNNCYTSNPFSTISSSGSATAHPSGYRTVMAQNNNVPTGTKYFTGVLGLSGEDSCQFQKLYCNSCADTNSDTIPTGNAPCTYDDGVTAPQQDEFNAEIFPNPTTGACQLQYDVFEPAFAQVSIYNELGTLVRMVSSGYSNAGPQSISLGTETLPSGNYVCRVRVGDQVNYINLVITK